MDTQDKYDELDNIIRTLDMLVEDLNDKYYIDWINDIKFEAENELEEVSEKLEEERKREEMQQEYLYESSVIQMYEDEENEDIPNLERDLELAEIKAELEKEKKWGIQVEENKYSEIIKGLSFEQLVYERAILKKKETNLYIQKKELDEEFKRRLENGSNVQRFKS